MHRLITQMSERRGLLLLAGPAAGVTLLAAACGSAVSTGPASAGYGYSAATATGGTAAGGNPYGHVAAPAGAAAPAGTAASLKVATSALGSFLTDGTGRTVYLFTRDSGTTSSCASGCASVWPPVTTSTHIQVGGGASASLLGTSQRAGGQTQVTYNGHPLYYFVGDAQPGQTNGEGLNEFGGLWYAISPSGMQVSA
jgi:predicted lipoprotein with Yx(FWY)xxD motif